jgi:hypothetical protein
MNTMHPHRPSRLRHVAAIALVLVVSGYLGARLFAAPKPVVDSAVPQGVVQLKEGAYQYTYHLVTGTEALFDLDADPRALRNLAKQQPERTARLRLWLMDDMQIDSLEELRVSEQDTIDRLKALGYL